MTGFKRRQVLKSIAAMMVSGLVPALVLAESGNLLAYPVEDAKSAYSTGQLEFVGIELADTVELPGLDERQAGEVRKTYRIRAMNRRWQTFANVEDDPEKLFRLRQYGTRFNMTLWRLIEKDKREKATRYRY
ncbi:hypothetical protein ACQUQU_08350 [Thalassolituus sp. LLYu03]|uniref:hypothetical protein n=1 Tax=Thalassolituus sp. LLYu03 TaxID=3421656 RepID=UPI003D2B68DF